MIYGGSSFGCGGNGESGPIIRMKTPYAPIKDYENLSRIIEKSYSDFFSHKKEEKPTMKVTYNGFTGELVKLERPFAALTNFADTTVYDLSIYDDEKKVTHSFTGIKLEDVKFSGGVMTFGG